MTEHNDQQQTHIQRLTQERDMLREKVQRFAKALGSNDERFGSLVHGLQVAIIKAELRAQQVVPASHLRYLLGDDEPVVCQDDDAIRDALADLTADAEAAR